MNASLTLYREQPSGIDVGETTQLKQVWNRFTNRNFYFCKFCQGWIEGRLNDDPFHSVSCLRCGKRLTVRPIKRNGA